jgi:hypothetical protein
MIDIRAAIEKTLTDAELLSRAQFYHSEIAGEVLSRNHERKNGGLRASDAGSCSLELWADINGKLDIPESPKGLLRMNNGSLVGAWLACLLKAGLEDASSNAIFVECERTVLHDGIPGHVDATLFVGDEDGGSKVLATVEFKLSAWTGDWRGDCKPAHRIQSGKYALAESAPQHFVVVYYASSPDRIYDKAAKEWFNGEWLVVHPFSTEETEFDVALEYERLRAALSKDAPEADPPEAWNCKYCRFSKCPRNKNPNRPATALAMEAEG